MTEALTVSGLEFAYPDGRVALRGVDLIVDEGERVALLGPNGAGKTTLALHLNGIYQPSSGSVSIGGIPVTEPNLPEIRRRVGLVFQDSNDQLFMPTVGEDVAFGPANLGLTEDEVAHRVGEALAVVGAEDLEVRPPHHLSGGEKRRAALATVLAMEPEVLVIDEPSEGLDPAGRRELIETLMTLPVTQVIITHDLPLALELCSRAVIMSAGKVVADGDTVEILGDADLLAANRLELPYRFSPDPDR
ncbi:MAG TPA: ABC transporter ATP-binding protein [Acidimicrobiia bacterium]|nr:ABC transporter ATP-binding protein [Acidimicrobiia bacterium]